MVLTTDLFAQFHHLTSPLKRGRFLPVVNYTQTWSTEHLSEWYHSIRDVS